MKKKVRKKDKNFVAGIISKIALFFGSILNAFLWVVFLGTALLIFQLSALEICNRVGIFPLYGFAFATVLYAVFVIVIQSFAGAGVGIPQIDSSSIARTLARQTARPKLQKSRFRKSFSFPNFRRKKAKAEQISAVLLLVKHRRTKQPQINKSVK